jgi:putative ABC transport system permease protein
LARRSACAKAAVCEGVFVLQDLRFALRLLAKERWFSAVAIVTLALGIGVNATVFTLVNAVLIRGLPFKDSQNLYMLAWQAKRQGQGSGRTNLSYPELKEWREQTKAFTGMGAWSGSNMNLSDDRGLPEQARGAFLTANSFSVLGQQPLLGRDFGPADERRGTDLAVIIGYRIWRTRYGGDAGVVGKLTRVNGKPAVIVGVMPEGMQFPQNNDIWAVFVPTEQQERRTTRFLNVFGRVRDGVSRTEAQTELNTIAGRLTTQYPKDYEEISGASLQTFNERFNGGPIRAVFLSMMGAVGFVLLIACANVANLLLARSAVRAREVAVRIAMGATRWRVVRQLLMESVLLGVLGGAFGLLIAVFGVRAFDAAVADSGKPYWIIFKMDFLVFSFLAAICVVTGVLFGIAPALHVSRTNVSGVLKEGGRGNAGGRRMRWLTGTMVVVEVALTLVLLVGAGLMVRSFLNLYRLDLGIRTERLMAMQLQLSGDKYQKIEARREFFQRLQPRLESLPGTEGIAITTGVPPFGSGGRRFEVDGRPSPKFDDAPNVGAVIISPSFFKVTGVAIVRGRGFTESDGTPGAENVIVNEKMAAQHFAGEDPIGKRIRFMQPPPPPNAPPPAPGQTPPTPPMWRTIVGISPTIRHSSPQEAEPPSIVYLPHRQEAPGFASVMVRSALPTSSVMDAVRREVSAVDPDQPVFNLRTVDQMLAQAMWPYRVFGSLFAIFALIGLLLSAVGLYAVVAYSVTQRTQEIGVRMALGAQGKQVTWMILRRGLLQLALGLSIGLFGGYFAGRALPSQILVGTTSNDPRIFVAITIILSIVAITACVVPARRAMRVDPLVALRAE